MNSYNWNIDWMACSPLEGNNSNVVVRVGWTANGQDRNGVTGSVTGVTTFPPPDSNTTFIQYNSLTKDIVLNWLWTKALDRDGAQTSIDIEIAGKKTPFVQYPNPW